MTSNLLKLMPRFFRTKIEHRPGLLKILDNIGWLFFDKVLRMGVGLLVGVWVARYLGPEQFGLLNFAMAFVVLFGAIATLGLQGIMVRDIVRHPHEARVTLGTGFVLRLFGGFAAFMLIIGVISYLRPDDTLAKTIVAILGFTMVINASEVVKYWFESQVQSKFVVLVQNGVFLIIAAVKVCMILLHAPLMAFVVAAFVETLLAAALLLAVYGWKVGRLTAWTTSFVRAKELLRDSWPLILSGLAIAVYMKIDQIMLGQMIGDQAVGIYSAAVRISEVWYFIPMAITSSVFPAIINAKKQSEELYYKRLQKLYDLMVWLAIAIALPTTFLAPWVIRVLYGEAFLPAAGVLSIHIWAGVSLFQGVAINKYIITENLQKYRIVIDGTGAILNVILNFYLIRPYGPSGAAIATLISYSSAFWISALLINKLRIPLIMNLKSYKNVLLLKGIMR